MMKKLTKLTKTLLVAAGLCMGQSAWADKVELWSLNFNSATEVPADWTNVNGHTGLLTVDDEKYLSVNSASDSRSPGYYYNGSGISSAIASYNNWVVEFDAIIKEGTNIKNYAQGVWLLGSATNVAYNTPTCPIIGIMKGSNENAYYVYVTNTKQTTNVALTSNTKYHYVFTYNKETKKITINIKNAAQTEDVLAETEYDYDYTQSFTIKYNDGKDRTYTGVIGDVQKIYMQAGRGNSGTTSINNIVVSTIASGDVSVKPSFTLKSVSGTSRTYTVTNNNSAGTLYYTTALAAEQPAVGDAAYTSLAYAEGASVDVVIASGTNNLYAYAVNGTATSEVVSQAVNGVSLTLNAPTINRISNTAATINASQSSLEGTPTPTIYYSYNGSDYAEYTQGSTITVAADAAISAYATATGYTNSATTTRAVALFPTVGITQVENAVRSNHTAHTLTDEAETVSERSYAALKLDDSRWGTKIKMQTTGWDPRPSNTWYVSAAQGTYAYILMPDMKAGDIIVADVDAVAKDIVNATYSEKYSIGNNFAYIVNANGNVELGFERISGNTNNYVRGFYAYTHNVTGTAIGATDCSTAWKGATTTPLTLKPGDSYRYQFVNYNNGANVNDQNWQLVVANEDNSADVLEIRADWWENLNGDPAEGKWQTYQRGFSSDAKNYWANVPSKMNGATVDMTVTFTADKKFTMTSTTVAEDGTSWTYNYTSDNDNKIDLTANAALTVYLTVAKNWLDLTATEQTALGLTTTAAGLGWATLYTDKALDFSGASGLTAYTATLNESTNTVTLTEVSNIPANTGVVLKSETTNANTTYAIPVIASSTTAQGRLTGSVTESLTYSESAEKDYYFLAINDEQEAQFTKLTSGTIAAGKAYLEVTKGSDARSLRVVFADETQGIESVSANAVNSDDCYDIQGRRVAQPQKGLYIKNGKKVVMK